MSSAVKRAIAGIDPTAWTTIKYPQVGCVNDLGQVLGLITPRRSPRLGSR
jgi:hypothetical protein